MFIDPDGREIIVYLYGADKSVSKADLKKIAKQVTANFKEMGLKTQVKVFKGKFNKSDYEKLQSTDAVAIIGNRDNVINSVSEIHEKQGAAISSFAKGGNPESSQNAKGYGPKNEQNIIAIGTEDTKYVANSKKVSFVELSTYLLVHGAGHNAGLQHSGEVQEYDKEMNKIFVPNGANVMNESLSSIRTLKELISSGVNRQSADNIKRTISIKSFFEKRFGTSNPKSTLPIENNE